MGNTGYFKNLISSFASTDKTKLAFTILSEEGMTDISYNKFAEDILRTITFFKRHNIVGAHIAFVAPTSYDLFVALFSVISSGNVAVMLNPTLPPEVLKLQCEKADAAYVCGNEELLSETFEDVKEIQRIPFSTLRSEKDPVQIEEVNIDQPDNTVMLIFTSGTTGKSKVVELSSSNLSYTAGTLEAHFSTGCMDSALSIVPRYHIGGIKGALALFQRHKTLYIGRGVRYIFLDAAMLHPNLIFLVPSMVDNLVKMLKRAKTQEERERIIGKKLERISVGGASLKVSTARYLMDMGISIDNGYGLSECSGSATWALLDQEHIGSIGKPFPGTQCRIENGEILVKSPAVMKGYYKDPEETKKVIVNGWLHTGDMGFCDKDGYYYLSGRKKNVIILSNGENINPEEIEEAFGNCENIIEALVYSDGKQICADIYSDNQLEAAAYIRRYNDGMPMDHQVTKINYSNLPLEKTGSGKIKRKECL